MRVILLRLNKGANLSSFTQICRPVVVTYCPLAATPRVLHFIKNYGVYIAAGIYDDFYAFSALPLTGHTPP